MRFFAKVMIIVSACALSALAISLRLTQIIGSGNALNNALKSSGVYSAAATTVKTELHKSINESANEAYKAPLNTAVDQTVTNKTVEQLIQPELKATAAWVKNGESAPPDFNFDLVPLKDSLVSATAATNIASSDQVSFEVTRVIPDHLALFGKTAGGDELPGSDQQPTLNILRTNYKNLERSLVIEFIIVLISLVLLIVLSWHNKRRMGRRVGFSFGLAAIIIIFLSYPFVFLLEHTIFASATLSGDKAPLEVARGILRYGLHGLAPYAIGLGLVAVILVAVSPLLPKPGDKKKDKKK